MNSKTFGYGRISGKDQNEDRQIIAFKEEGIDERDIYIDKQSGKDFNREKYIIVKNILRENDLLVIPEIDRLGRNYNMILEEWRDITKVIKADIKVLGMPILDTSKYKDLLGTVINDIILALLSYCAEQERKFNRKRCREGIDAMPVVNGKRISVKTNRATGRPRIEKPINFDEVVARWLNKEITAVQAQIETGLKNNTFYSMVKEKEDK